MTMQCHRLDHVRIREGQQGVFEGKGAMFDWLQFSVDHGASSR
jgi:hypothetical protein